MKKKKKIWIISVSVLAIAIVLFFIFKEDNNNDNYSTVKAESGELIQTVSEVGMVKPVKELSLSFLTSGKIGEIYAQVGEEVEKDQVLAALDKESLELNKIEAEASLKIAKSNLSKTLAGATQETINVSLSELEQAKNNKASAEKNLEQTRKTVEENIEQATKNLFDLEDDSLETKTSQEQAVYSAQTALNNAKRSGQVALDNSRSSVLLILDDKILVGEVALDNLKTILEDDDAENILGVKNRKTLTSTENKRNEALALLPEVKLAVSLAQETGSLSDINLAGALVKDFLLKTSQSLNYAFSMLEATITSADFSESDLNAYKNLVTSQNTQVGSALSSVENSLQAFNTAKTNYDTSVATAEENLRQAEVALDNAIIAARNNLNNTILSGQQQITTAESNLNSAIKSVNLSEARLNSVSASPRYQDVSLAEAKVSQAEAALNNIINQIENSIIYAPLDGVITEINYDVGEQYSMSGQEVIRMLADNNFEIDVDISESDINKVKIGDSVDITLDAFSDDVVLPGTVTFIEPAQTLIQGVVYYKVTILFTNLEEVENILTRNNLSLKSGMTANVTIKTASQDNVIYVPARSIIEENGEKIIRVLINEEVVKRKVETGLRGDGGLIEIKEGLESGEEVITFIRNSEN